jgi:type I restriction enzyme R subunit
MAYLSEAAVEKLVLDDLTTLGYSISSDAEIGPDGKAPERDAYSDVVLAKRLVAAIEKLNPAIPAGARGDALRKVMATERPSRVSMSNSTPRTVRSGVTRFV